MLGKIRDYFATRRRLADTLADLDALSERRADAIRDCHSALAMIIRLTAYPGTADKIREIATEAMRT